MHVGSIRLIGLPLTRGISTARLLIQGGILANIVPLLLSEMGIGIICGNLG